MKIKDAQYKQVVKTVNERVSQDVYGCDNCKKVIDFNLKDVESLEATVFKHAGNTESNRLEFCSWKCCIVRLRKVKTDYFISLPFLSFDNKQNGLKAKDFFALFPKDLK